MPGSRQRRQVFLSFDRRLKRHGTCSMAGTPSDNTSQPMALPAAKHVLPRLRSAAISGTLIAIATGVVLASTRWNMFVGDRAIQTTDDAQLRADITPLSTKSAG